MSVINIPIGGKCRKLTCKTSFDKQFSWRGENSVRQLIEISWLYDNMQTTFWSGSRKSPTFFSYMQTCVRIIAEGSQTQLFTFVIWFEWINDVIVSIIIAAVARISVYFIERTWTFKLCEKVAVFFLYFKYIIECLKNRLRSLSV